MKARNPVFQSISLNQSKKGLLYRNNYEGVVSYTLSDCVVVTIYCISRK